MEVEAKAACGAPAAVPDLAMEPGPGAGAGVTSVGVGRGRRAGSDVDTGAGEGRAETSEEGKAGEVYNIKGVEAAKPEAAFRQYQDDDTPPLVREHYRAMRANQSVAFSRRMAAKWHTFDKKELTMREAFDLLEGYVDTSDPDITLPNVLHAFQTAEAARAAGEPEWLVLTAFIHDCGKIMGAPGMGGEAKDGQKGTREGPQWALGGDTWVVGVPIPGCVVLPEFNALNPDHGKYSGVGIYKEGCGMANLQFAYGHDEYMYQMLVHNKCTLPKEALAIIRYHSCYPWHKGGAYKELEAPGDAELKEWVIRFNKYDLYSKAETLPDADALWPYYQGLIDRYCPGKLKW